MLYVTKVVKYFLLTVLFITIVLLSFLLAGCAVSTESFSDVHLMELKFNRSSDFYPFIANTYLQNASASGGAAYSDLSVKVGYLGMCVSVNGTLSCATNSQIQSLASQFSSVTFSSAISSANAIVSTGNAPANVSTTIDLLTLASKFSAICHPYVLMATIVLSLVLFMLLLWASLHFLPWKLAAKKLSCVFSFAALLTWGLGSMLQQEAITGAKKIVGPASMNILVSTPGTRSVAMTWTSFAFLLLVCLGTLVNYVRELSVARGGDAAERKDAPQTKFF